MIIETIKLCNFGSYEGETILDTRPRDDRTIILIGGKNGAGKTTLFSAMRICLYGHMSMGYRNRNAYYLRAILKLINNTAKLSKPVHSYVEMQIVMSNGRDVDTYNLRREWLYEESVTESFSVKKNGMLLNEEDLADFEKFLLSIIPPDLFNLYFFDGERIADFFLDEGSNSRIRSAFLTISGYDVFEIMRKNFKRISSSGQKTTPHLGEYLEAKERLENSNQNYRQYLLQLEHCLDEIQGTDATIAALEKDYYQKGGITQEEWNQKLFTLKDEEKKRETYNAVLKKWANETVPFIMIRGQIVALKLQIEQENELLQDNPNVTYLEELHLGVSLRSFRAEKLSAFVHSLLSFDGNAAALYTEIKDRYPIVLTRDMAKARKWLHEKVRGTERTGILVTKESARFKPLAVHILPSGDENAVHWFLEDKADTRSSNYLEDAATEIQVQGLELDYTCLLWDADMRYDHGKWRFYKFNGQTKWVEQTPTSESKQELIKYMLNAYRVLLTRARSGMVICVPEGNGNKTPTGFWEDSTRLPEYYDGTYQYLKSLGIEGI